MSRVHAATTSKMQSDEEKHLFDVVEKMSNLMRRFRHPEGVGNGYTRQSVMDDLWDRWGMLKDAIEDFQKESSALPVTLLGWYTAQASLFNLIAEDTPPSNAGEISLRLDMRQSLWTGEKTEFLKLLKTFLHHSATVRTLAIERMEKEAHALGLATGVHFSGISIDRSSVMCELSFNSDTETEVVGLRYDLRGVIHTDRAGTSHPVPLSCAWKPAFQMLNVAPYERPCQFGMVLSETGLVPDTVDAEPGEKDHTLGDNDLMLHNSGNVSTEVAQDGMNMSITSDDLGHAQVVASRSAGDIATIWETMGGDRIATQFALALCRGAWSRPSTDGQSEASAYFNAAFSNFDLTNVKSPSEIEPALVLALSSSLNPGPSQ